MANIEKNEDMKKLDKEQLDRVIGGAGNTEKKKKPIIDRNVSSVPEVQIGPCMGIKATKNQP